MSVSAVVVARDLHPATVLGECLPDGNRIGLCVDRECLPVGDAAADLGKRALDPCLGAVVGGDRVGHSFALDQPYVAPVRGDDQAVGLDHVDGEESSE